MQKRTLKRTKTNFGSDKSENEPLPKRTLANKEAKIGLYKNESWSEIKAKSARWKAKIGGGGTVYIYKDHIRLQRLTTGRVEPIR